ncbi:hypothetical protein [Sinomicrobium sp. M5D2P9]
MNNWTIFALTLVFIGNIGGLLIIILQSTSSIRDKNQIIQVSHENKQRLEQELVEIRNERSKLKIDLETRDNENKKLSKEIVKLNRELLEKTNEFNNFMGASGVFPIVSISSLVSTEKEYSFTFTINNDNKYPVYDININIMDFNKILKNSKLENGKYIIKQDKFKESLISVFEEKHLPAFSNIITPTVYHYTDNVFYLKIKSRSSFVFEKIALVREGNKVYNGFQIKNQEGKVLKEWLGENTPPKIETKLRENFDLIPEKLEMNFIN